MRPYCKVLTTKKTATDTELPEACTTKLFKEIQHRIGFIIFKIKKNEEYKHLHSIRDHDEHDVRDDDFIAHLRHADW